MASTLEFVVKQLQVMRCRAGVPFEQERHIDARAVVVETKITELVVGCSWVELFQSYELLEETNTALPDPPEMTHIFWLVGWIPAGYDSKSSNHTEFA